MADILGRLREVSKLASYWKSGVTSVLEDLLELDSFLLPDSGKHRNNE
jgi:hypothetical protein